MEWEKNIKMKKRETKILLVSSNLFLVFLLILLSCGTSTDKSNQPLGNKDGNSMGYNLSNPDETIILPPVLHEISGIAVIDSSSVACVQDENGIVFIYDLQRKEIKKLITFHGNGDYEGITQANGTIYILRSDGVLFEINDFKSSSPANEIRLKGIPHSESEGLCYYRENNWLLIAPKDKADKDSETDVKRGIYGFDLNRRELIEKPVTGFDLSAIKEFALENKIFPEPEGEKKNKENEPDIKFRTSAIGIHPVTGKLFVLSAEDQMLFVFNPDGIIEYMVRLDPEIFNMPEGITFFENGDMLISNEGQNKNATLLRFNYK
jgi:hypothetical protein